MAGVRWRQIQRYSRLVKNRRYRRNDERQPILEDMGTELPLLYSGNGCRAAVTRQWVQAELGTGQQVQVGWGTEGEVQVQAGRCVPAGGGDPHRPMATAKMADHVICYHEVELVCTCVGSRCVHV